ncbi:MAG: hypothetical protein OXC60_00675 [Litoreibacter sp.]|nr:hypothetical protein [Litoreibacter sp.]
MDKFSNFPTTPISPARNGEQVSPSDSTDLSQVSRALYIGQGGDLNVVMADGATILFEAVPGGSLLPVRAERVTASGTSASGIVALW